jgi:hypothetical protein
VLVKFDEHSRSAQTDSGAVALYGVALATLDDDPGLRPDAHAFITDKAPWFAVTEAVAEPPSPQAIGVDLPIPQKTYPSHGAMVAGLAGGNSVR